MEVISNFVTNINFILPNQINMINIQSTSHIMNMTYKSKLDPEFSYISFRLKVDRDEYIEFETKLNAIAFNLIKINFTNKYNSVEIAKCRIVSKDLVLSPASFQLHGLAIELDTKSSSDIFDKIYSISKGDNELDIEIELLKS